ncbi:hypothetical protein OYB23_24455 [Escherichia coli]|nr:hypothetical protein [Escherichia coli]
MVTFWGNYEGISQGKVLKNPSGEPNVDAASFQAFGAFAADKRSVYFDGQRTDDR